MYGWAAQPRDVSVLLDGKKNNNEPKPQTVADTSLPDTQLATAVLEYARKQLPTETFNHSMRVYYYGTVALPSTRWTSLTADTSQAKQFRPSNSPIGASPTRPTS